MVKEFKKEFLLDELNLPECAIEDKVTSVSRWSVNHSIIFEHDGKFYRTTYSCGATEYQDEWAWDYEDTVTCVEVEQKEVLTKQWMPKED